MVDETYIASYQKLLKRQRVRIFLAGLEGDFQASVRRNLEEGSYP